LTISSPKEPPEAEAMDVDVEVLEKEEHPTQNPEESSNAMEQAP